MHGFTLADIYWYAPLRQASAMAWDPRVARELKALREDQERRAYESHLRRNPAEEEEVMTGIFSARARYVKNARLFNETVSQMSAIESRISQLRFRIPSVSSFGCYTCREGALVGGFFSAKIPTQTTELVFIRSCAVTGLMLTYLFGLREGFLCTLVFVMMYCFLVRFGKRLTRSEVISLHNEIREIREEIKREKLKLRDLREVRVRSYLACCVGDRHEAFTTTRIEHEDLPGYILNNYG